MVLEVGRWVIRKALADYKKWCSCGITAPRIAVNVSAVQLKQPDFENVVRAAIEDAGDTPHGLDIEITESMIMEDVDGAIEKLRAVRNYGVEIAIDDFGTGYSSLGYLARLPVHTLKIDRSFIASMVEQSESRTIVSTIISLAHALNLKVVAEGVDAEDQVDLLARLKCDEIQGYLVGRPMSADDLMRRL